MFKRLNIVFFIVFNELYPIIIRCLHIGQEVFIHFIVFLHNVLIFIILLWDGVQICNCNPIDLFLFFENYPPNLTKPNSLVNNTTALHVHNIIVKILKQKFIIIFSFFQKTPFANPTTNTELSQFIREWQAAPPLKTFTEVPTIAEQVQDLSKQLETYELDMYKFEDVLQSICESPNNN